MSSNAISRFAKAPHKAVARAVGTTLILGDVEAFAGLSMILRAKLTPEERRGLAWAALRACDNEEIEAVVDTILPAEEGAGSPLPPFDGAMAEAAFWVDYASPEEIEAYALVCFESLPAGDQAEFLAYAQSRRQAA